MSEKHELINDKNLYYCFVNIENKTNLFRFFIVPSKIVAKYVEVQHKFWLDNHPKLKNNVNSMRQFRIGLADNNYQISTPLASKYENNWDFNSND